MLVITLLCEDQNWRKKEKAKDNIAKVTISIYPIPISSDPHTDSLNELQAKRFLNWTGTKILEEVAWTLREHSTKTKQQVSWDYFLILEISWEENLIDSGKFANSWSKK